MMNSGSLLRKQHAEWAATLAARRPVEAERPGAATGERGAVEVEYLAYGPGDGDREIVAVYGDVEPEYAALRRGVGVFDATNRGTIEVGGAGRVDFLDRMLTQKVKDLASGNVRESFLVNRQGRLEGDLLVVALDDRVLIDVDVHQAASVTSVLDGFLFDDDVTLADASGRVHRIALHGPRALDALFSATGSVFYSMDEMTAVEVEIAGAAVVAARRDQIGEPGVELFMTRDAAPDVWAALLETDASVGEGKQRVRPVGWYAWNIARIEAGEPLANIDFGTTNLPHETGLVSRRVSFAKGCYPGQEVVARIHNLGKPKQMLVGLRILANALPVAGAQVFDKGESTLAEPIGVITSSAPSPMLGSAPVAFAMLRTAHTEPGTTVLVNAEGEQVEAEVSALEFLEPDGEAQA